MKKYIGTPVFNKVYCNLLGVARKEGTTNYIDIAQIMGLPPGKPMGNHWQNETAQILGEICEYEYNHNRPMLSAVVVSKSTGKPGEGFSDLAKRLGKPTCSSPTFWNQEIQEVYNTWK